MAMRGSDMRLRSGGAGSGRGGVAGELAQRGERGGELKAGAQGVALGAGGALHRVGEFGGGQRAHLVLLAGQLQPALVAIRQVLGQLVLAPAQADQLGTIALGAFTFTMDALPGTPQIQNIIPASFFGTDAWAAPVLGTLGGIGLLIGPVGLLAERWKRDSVLVDEARYGMDIAFIVMLFLTSLTGMALLVLRETAAMGPLLALHLGVVFSLFVTMPYGKFVHGIYRFVALVRYAMERKAMAHT